MDIKQLNTFLTVSSLLNFTKAAEQLGYAQSSITAQIQQLENELGTVLFERIGKKVILTEAGRKLILYASQILQLSNDMINVISNSEKPQGTLTIGAAESLSIYRLPDILKEYRRSYPEVDIELKLLNCSEYLSGLSDGSVDVAFSIGSKIESNYIKEVIKLPEQIKVLVYPGHPFTRREKITAADFDRQAVILTGKDCCYRGAFMRSLSEENIIPRIVLETDSIQVIKQAAMSGLGICILPAVAAGEETAEGKLIPVDYDTKDFKIISQLFYHKDKYISPALSEFIKISYQILNKQ